VPLLQLGDLTLSEYVASLGYLSDLHPEARLLGDGTPRARAEVMRWVGFLNSDVHKSFGPIFTPQRYLPEPAFVGRLAAAARIRVRGHLKRLEERLVGRDWLSGERSVADAYLFVITRWANGKRIGLPEFPNLSRFADRMHSDAGVRAALAREEAG
jgi:glutathione S-transferase